MKRRQVDEQVDPIELAIATPDEPFDAEPLLAFDGRSVTWRKLRELQAARGTQLHRPTCD